jgi:pilus assembly protein CpaB
MNRRRVVTIIAAILLTLFGMVVVIAYVNSAEGRAQENAELVSILVATEEIPAGTPAASLAGSRSVALRQVPQAVRAEDAVQDLDALGDQVTLERILANEPIVARHFGDPAEAQRPGSGQVEEGLEIITVALEPQRALGGEIAAGDLVGVIVSLEDSGGSDEAATTDPTTGGGDEATSGMVLAGVPVTGVSGVDPEAGAPGDLIMVSLQVDEPDAERIAFGAEFGRLWLTRQAEGETTDTRTRSREDIFDGLGSGN